MKAVYIGCGIVVFAVVGAYIYEQVSMKPVLPDASLVNYNTATWDNSAYATAQVQAYGPFQPQPTPVPTTPYGWDVFQRVNQGGTA